MSDSENNAIDAASSLRQLRLLVAIASYGEKNVTFLNQIIARYQRMAMKVDVVVLSEAPKDLGPAVKVLVGLPSKNPWSLPFAHKKIFAQNVDKYDLFAYSEDDIEITEANLNAFLRVTAELNKNEIAGFQLYEVDESGRVTLPGVHGPFHWKPDSVRQRGAYVFAEFSNEHSASYVLTQAQLKRAIASGGFLREPYEGRYDMLCTAGTDPYTSCGFRKVLCISEIESFLLHHLPDRYAGKLGLSMEMFKEQIQILQRIQRGLHPATTLCETQSQMPRLRWSKSHYEAPCEEVLSMVPAGAKRILSVGCGWGAAEVRLQRHGAAITAVPLESVTAGVVARRGLEVVCGTLAQCLAQLGARTFDCILITNLLHLQPDPGRFLDQWSKFVGKSGTLVVSGPNFNHISDLIKRIVGINGYRKLHRFHQSGVSMCGPGTVARHLTNSGFNVTRMRWFDHAVLGRQLPRTQMSLGGITAKYWVLRARG